MKPRIVLDISRLLSRAAHPVPTGIDRVELAYAEWLLAHEGARLDFVAVHPLGRFALLPHALAARFIANTARRWRVPGQAVGPVLAEARRLRAALMWRSALPWRGGNGIYLLTSHHHLDKPALLAAMRQRIGRLACFIHDLIPTDFPEYARPGQPERHAKRMRNAAEQSDFVVVNSQDTADGFARCLAAAGRNPPVLVAPLGVESMVAKPAAASEDPPFFLFIGTIEPRKNHLLLLHIWRRLAAGAEPPPRLVLVGRRGWENENILDMLERCPALTGVVEERNAVPDQILRQLLSTARALLLPSFAEGYGLPLAEALASGLPSLCSDLPALREVGGNVPEYLDPLDGPSWTRAILDYTPPNSVRRAQQLHRLRDWQPPLWDTHMRAVMRLLDGP